jgi:hypothetical protein
LMPRLQSIPLLILMTSDNELRGRDATIEASGQIRHILRDPVDRGWHRYGLFNV